MLVLPIRNIRKVAPRAGAWIETGICRGKGGIEWSPLAQGRGLKLWCGKEFSEIMKSPLAQGRGLKPGLVEEEADN